MSILIQNGTLICPEGPVQADLRVEGNKIAEIGPNLPVGDSQVIDAAGKLVFPGFIDTHTHFEMNKGTIRETADCIRVSRICALVIGKMMHAAELGIRLAVAPDSYCRQEDLLLPEEDYVTIVGNLLENAVEELSRGEHDLKEIRLALYCRPDCNVIVCEDTGGGVDPEIQPHIFEKGVSSKGEGRGLGLCLIHQLVEQHHGTIDVMTEAGAGTCFTLTFTDSVPEEA